MVKITVQKDKEISANFSKEIKKYMDSKRFSLRYEYNIGNGSKIDCCVMDSQEIPYVYIEFKSFLNSSFACKSGKKQLLSYLKKAEKKAKFCVLTDSNIFYLYKAVQKNERFEKVSFDHLVITLFPEAKDLFVPKNCRIINKLLLQNELQISELKKSDIVYENGAFSFLGEYQKFIEKQFPPFNTRETMVCRYISLETVFAIIKNKSLKMNCIIGMNDSTEPDFVESMLYEGMEKLAGLQRQARDVYIMSCSSKDSIDDLTQWRLYGNDAKGVCLVFNVKRMKKSRFKLGKVSYLDRNLPIKSIEHINTFFEEIVTKTKIPFAPRDFHCWAHFYKPLEYKIEREIRLVYVNNGELNKEWILSKPFNIVNSSVEVPLNTEDFPLKLCKIILGPKCPEREVNLKQIEIFLKESKLDDVDVEYSTIDSYR